MTEDVRKSIAAAGTGGPGAAGLSVQDVSNDRFVLIYIQGLHCHRCEQAIRKALSRCPGVHEVEVDFASGQASVLYDADAVSPVTLVDAVREAGYKPTGFTQSHGD